VLEIEGHFAANAHHRRGEPYCSNAHGMMDLKSAPSLQRSNLQLTSSFAA